MPDKKPPPHSWKTTLAICACCFVLGIPVSATAINLEMTPFVAGPTKKSDTIIEGPHMAIFAAGAFSITASAVVMLAAIVMRHLNPNMVMLGLVGFGLSVINFAAQLIILGVVYVTNSLNPETKNIADVKLVDGVYDAGGKQFTHETWSCMMGNLYQAKEPWSTNACSEYHYARYCTILLVNTAFLLLAIAYWPVRNHLFFGKSEKAVAANRGKA